MSKFVWQQAVDVAVAKEGSREAVAKKLGIKRQAIREWGEKMPPRHVLGLEAMSGFSRYQLRPDIYGDPPKQSGDPPKRNANKRARPRPCVQRSEARA